jgi:TolB-like protein/Tfp pilus assembly protein PilF
MGADEAGTARAVREHREAARPIVASHGGRIVKTTGDGLLLEFPSVVAAVECAILIQKMMAERNADLPEAKRILYRIGVNLGDVLIEGDDILGDGVNVAARLEGICETGGLCVSGSAYEHVQGRVAADFADLGEQSLKNILKPVRAYALSPKAIAAAKVEAAETTASAGPTSAPEHREPPKPGEPSTPKKHAALAPVAAGIASLIIMIAASAWFFYAANRPVAVAPNPAAPAEAKHLSIVVLPFANLSGDAGQDYFADGITENLTTELSRIHNSFVIARNTAFTFKGRNIDAKEIGTELGVRYVLEGSVQREGARVRVNAQLVDAETGAHLWADRFEEDVADLFKLQDEVVARLANSLGNELFKAEAERGARSKNPDAIDLTLRGTALLFTEWRGDANKDKDRNDEARALLERALKIDPDNVYALVGDAATYINERARGWTDSRPDYEARTLGQIDRAIALAPNSAMGYGTKAWYLRVAHRQQEALRAADAALAINPNDAGLYADRGWVENELGRFEQAKYDVLQAMRLSPRDPNMGSWHTDLGTAELGLGHFDTAIEEFQEGDNFGDIGAAVSLPAAYALAGKMDEAKLALEKARSLEPELTLKWLAEGRAPVSVLVDGLRKAGLPEE